MSLTHSRLRLTVPFFAAGLAAGVATTVWLTDLTASLKAARSVTAPVALGSPAPPSGKPSPAPVHLPADWKIAFERNEGERTDIWLANSDGSNQKRIIQNGQKPQWSPDHKKLTFVRGGNVFIADIEGKGIQQVTRGEDAVSDSYSWNARYNLISYTHPETYRIQMQRNMVQEEGSSIRHRRIPGVVEIAAPEYDIAENQSRFSFSKNRLPTWAPSGNQMLFTRNGDIWLAKKDSLDTGTGTPEVYWDATRILSTASYDGTTVGGSRWSSAPIHLAWAPDESFFIYEDHRIGGSGIHNVVLVRRVVTTDAEGDKSVTWEEDKTVSLPAYNHPSISPDGKWVLFIRYDDTVASIWAVAIQGGQEQVVVKNASAAAW